jgi:DNA replication licensing factor MCM2
MPRSKEVILNGDQVDTVRPGDELILTGIYRCLYDAATNARTCFPVYKTELDAVHVHRKGELKMSNLTDEQQSEILELAKQPNIRERIIASMAPSIYGMHYVKTAIALSMMGGQRKEVAGKHRIRGDINTLIVGDPGLAKSQFLKYVEQTFPKAVYTTGKGASAVGLTAALTKDDNGDYALEGGAMVLADDGICLIDEFDKMSDQDRTSIHEAMEQQTISISKAGIVATLQARCSVIAVANPTDGRYDPQQTFKDNVNLSDPILSRFDMLCVLKDEADPINDERLADHVVCSHIRSHPDATSEDKQLRPRLQQRTSHLEPIPQDILQRYIQYARKRVHPKMMDLDKQKLATFYQEIRAEAFRSGGAPMTARHIESIIRIAEANARMELRQHVNSRDLDHAIETMLESFIQSQKHQVAEELRRRFKRYMTAVTPMADQLMILLEKLFNEQMEKTRAARPQAMPPDVSEVSLDIEELIQRMERIEIDIEAAHEFMRSERFNRLWRLEGQRLFRVV